MLPSCAPQSDKTSARTIQMRSAWHGESRGFYIAVLHLKQGRVMCFDHQQAHRPPKTEIAREVEFKDLVR